MASTHICEPKCDAISSISAGVRSAAELTATLSAPASSKRSTSLRVLTPPPTVKGMESSEATLLTISVKVFLPSTLAVMSRKTSSSAICSEYIFPISTGSPASRRPRKFIPLTVRPSFTSRHGIMRLANMVFALFEFYSNLFQVDCAFVYGSAENNRVNSCIIKCFNIVYVFHTAACR